MALAARLAQHLSPEELAELLRFLEDRRDGTLVLVKQAGRVVGTVADWAPRAAQAR